MIIYKVQYGDTLYSIAHRFGIYVEMLAVSNNIFWPYQVFEGQELMVPTTMSNMDLNLRNHRQQYYSDDIKKILSQEGTAAGGVLKFTFPRLDLFVRIFGFVLEPDLALTSWAAFYQPGENSMVMGDLVLLEREVGPVMSSLIKDGIEITALHNHLMNESPRIMYLHFKGEGPSVRLAQIIRSALSLTATPFKVKSQQLPPETDWKTVEDTLGLKGSHKGNVLQLSIPRTVLISDGGHQLPPAMGISHSVNFQSYGDKVAAVTGDFVLLANEVNPVAAILKKNNIDVTAIHNHMLTESPRLFYMHFWAVNSPEHLAQALKSVLDLAK